MWAYLYLVRNDQPLVINGRTLTEREKFYLSSGISLVVVFFLTSVGSLLFYALCIGLAGASLCEASVFGV
jgi:hypothetical protein